jgi:hypothetical protein
MRLAPAQLDEILALQLTIAWAGESAGEPTRLGWWKTDLVDREGGGDLFSRLLPRTAAWTGLSLVRAAARRVDEMAREKVARGDRMWTPFHFGFEVDEQLDDRIAYHRRHEHKPAEVLGKKFLVGAPWLKSSLEKLLESLGTSSAAVTPAGRQIRKRARSPMEALPLLFGALLPLAPAYPLPHIEQSL